MPTITDRVLAMLACPVCRGGLSRSGDTIVCRECGRQYPVRDGIPVLIASEAVTAANR